MNKKEFKYHLKKDVRDDLENLDEKISLLLKHDDEGFKSIPSWSILLSLFNVYSHLTWCREFRTWFKEVY